MNYDALKDMLPSILSSARLKKESVNSYAGPCPKCGGSNRFVYRTDTQRFWCRKCRPPEQVPPGDIIEFYCWLYHLTPQELALQYQARDHRADPGALWEKIPQGVNYNALYQFLAVKRKIHPDTVKDLFNKGDARFSHHRGKDALALPFKNLDNQVRAVQFLSLDQKPFNYSDKNKVFSKGSRPSDDCFFQCGPSPADADAIVLTEAAINAMSGKACCPSVCFLAIGASGFTQKTRLLKNLLDQGQIIICFFDNDRAGQKAAANVFRLLGPEILSIKWPDHHPKGCDINDLLKMGQPKIITDMIHNAGPVKMNQPQEKAKGKTTSSLPVIITSGLQLRELSKQAWDAVQKKNQPPSLYNHSTGIATVQARSAYAKDIIIEKVSAHKMIHILSNAADWYAATDKRHPGRPSKPVHPPKGLAENLLVDPAPPLPVLKRIMSAPYFMKDLGIHKTTGYSKSSQCILAMPPGMNIPEVSKNPNEDEKEKAKQLIHELICDFPFVSESEKAHAIALVLLPFVREIIDGPTPLHLVEASTPGTGKTLLVTVAAGVFLGAEIPTMTEGRSDEEWRKRITAKLMSNPSFVLIDNIRNKIDVSALAAAITSSCWEDRLLGHSEMINLNIHCCWAATGNNLSLSSEIARRTVRILLNTNQDRPWDRDLKTFRHPDLVKWAREHRHHLIWAAMTMVQVWISQGFPRPRNTLGSFENWSNVIGGILEANQIPGFLSNLNDFYESSDSEGSTLRSFITCWYQAHGSAPCGVSELYNLIFRKNIPLDIGEKSERSQKIRLGKILSQIRDRRFDIELEDEQGNTEASTFKVSANGKYQGAMQWRLVLCK